ncbi:cache domain-containing protein [Chloroflexota bacterium]
MKKRIVEVLVVVLLTLMSLSLVGSIGCMGINEGNLKTKLEMGVAGVAALTDNHIENCVNMLEVLAATEEVKSRDWEIMLPLLTKADADMIPGPKWFGLPDGSYYVLGIGKTEKNNADRAYFSVVMSGSNTYSDLIVSRSTGEKALVVAVPIIKEGEVVGILGTVVFLEDLSDIISEQLKLSDDIVFYAVTAENQVALHTNTEMIFEDKPESPENSVSLTAPFTGWRITLGYNN